MRGVSPRSLDTSNRVRPPTLALHGEGALGFALSLHLEVAEVFEHEEALAELLRVSAGHDLSGLGHVQEPRRQVHGVADRGVVHPEIAADGPHHHGAGVDPDPHEKVSSVHPLDVGPDRRELLLDGQGRPQGASGVVLVGDRRAEEGHHAVPEELVDGPLVAVDRRQDHLEGSVHEGVDILGVQALRQSR